MKDLGILVIAITMITIAVVVCFVLVNAQERKIIMPEPVSPSPPLPSPSSVPTSVPTYEPPAIVHPNHSDSLRPHHAKAATGEAATANNKSGRALSKEELEVRRSMVRLEQSIRNADKEIHALKQQRMEQAEAK